MFRCLLFFVALLLSPVATHADTNNQLSDIKVLQQIMADVHPGYGRYNSAERIAERDKRLLDKVQSGLSDLQLYAELSRYLASFRCDHTVAELSEPLKAQKRTRFSPFQFVIFNDRIFVSAGQAPLKRGDEIIAINGFSSGDIISRLTPYVSIDGYTTHVIPSKIAFSGDLYGSVFEELFAPVVLGLDQYPDNLSLEIRAQDSQTTKTMRLATIDFERWKKLSNRQYRLDFKDAVSYEVQDGVAILRVDTFVNYRQPVDAMTMFDAIFSDLNTRKVKRLVVDLRRNGGGSDDAQLALLAHLARESFQINNAAWYKGEGALKWQAELSTWDRTIFQANPTNFPVEANGHSLPVQLLGGNYQPVEPARNVFQGEIIMLTSIDNASASAGALGVLAQQPGIHTLGQPTGGNLGGTTATIIAFHKLESSGITARVPMIRNQYNISSVKDGYGAMPDQVVEITLEDWLSGTDKVLETALRWQM